MRRIPREYVLLGLASATVQILYLWLLPISFEGDAGGYFLYALYLVGDPRGEFLFVRPPGFPFFMAATGLTWLHNFDLAVAMQAAMGTALPLLMFGILRPVSRSVALAASALLIVSGVPYTYAKLFTSEQVYLFCVMATIWSVARFITAARPKPLAAMIATAGAVAALMVRNEAVYFALFSFLVLLIAAWPVRRLRAIVSLSGGVAILLVMAWSMERARIMGEPAVAGTLSNFTGTQIFWRIYIQSGADVRRWRCVVDERCPSEREAALFAPENGAATRRVLEMVREWAIKSGYEPNTFVASWISDPADQGTANKFAVAANEAVRIYGHAKADQLLKRVALEAVAAHPDIILGMVADAGTWFGVSFEAVVNDLRWPNQFALPIFMNWGKDAYEVMGIDVAGMPPETPETAYLWQEVRRFEAPAKNSAAVAQRTMTPELWQAYRRADRGVLTRPLEWRLLTIGQTAHNIVLNAVGPVFLITWPALFFARRRLLALYLLGCFGLYLAAYSIAFGYNMRFEHLILSLMIMPTAVSTQVLAQALRKRLWRRSYARRTADLENID